MSKSNYIIRICSECRDEFQGTIHGDPVCEHCRKHLENEYGETFETGDEPI